MRLIFSLSSILLLLSGCATIDSNGFVTSPLKTSNTIYSSSLSENFDPNDINTINSSSVPTKQQIKFEDQERYQDKLNDLPEDTSDQW